MYYIFNKYLISCQEKVWAPSGVKGGVLFLKPKGLLVIFLILVAYFAGFLLLSFIVRKKLAHKMQKT
jgi:hypothetical protein